MRISVFRFVIILTGAFIRWKLSGSKEPFDNVMSRPFDTDLKYDLNFFTGLAFWLLFCLFIMYVVTPMLYPHAHLANQPRVYELK